MNRAQEDSECSDCQMPDAMRGQMPDAMRRTDNESNNSNQTVNINSIV